MDQQARQALNRLAFGPRPGDVGRVINRGVDRWIADQLDPASIDDASGAAAAAAFETQHLQVRDLTQALPPQDVLVRRLRTQRGVAGGAPFVPTAADSALGRALDARATRFTQQIVEAKVARAEASERQLQEVLVDFWENHFSVFSGKMPTRFTLLEWERDVIRPHALGRFRELLGAVAKSAAMLYYLDNWQSRADTAHLTLGELRAAQKAPGRPPRHRHRGGLNENYARELLELHTLGVDGGYTQHDVVEAARALTGWSLDGPREGGGFIFRPEMHDADAKTILGHTFPAGRGIEDGEDLLDLVARHAATGHHIAMKLAIRLVGDSVPPVVVERAARAFTETGGDIRETVRAIVTSPEFFSRAAYRAKVKSPFELVVSARRALAAAPDTTPRTAQLVAHLGEPLFGHLAPNGYPERGDEWLNGGSILARINFGIDLAAGRVPGLSLDRWPPATALASAPFAAQVDGVVAWLLEGEASPDTRAILLGGQNPLARRSAGTTSAVTRPSLKDLVGLTLGAPEFQRR